VAATASEKAGSVSTEREQLAKLAGGVIVAVRDIREFLLQPVTSQEEIWRWPLYIDDDGVIWCGDQDCPLEAENSMIAEFSGDFTLARLHEAIEEHIAARREREADQ